jgi:hypothetical protein
VLPLQTTPQPPQFFGSFPSFTHLPPQHEKPMPHAGMHAPPASKPPLLPPLPPLLLPEPLLPPLLPPPELPPPELPPLLPEPDELVASTDASPPPRGDETEPPQLATIATRHSAEDRSEIRVRMTRSLLLGRLPSLADERSTTDDADDASVSHAEATS